MERKKEKILMQSMRRKQQQEELRQQKEQEAQKRKEEERLKEEEKQRKKEEEKARRAIIFEQYKLKKAMEEAEKEGRPFEMPDHLMGGAGGGLGAAGGAIGVAASRSGPKMRSKTSGSMTLTRQRPKTIHIDAGSDFTSRTLTSARGKRGSGTSLAGKTMLTASSTADVKILSRRSCQSQPHPQTL